MTVSHAELAALSREAYDKHTFRAPGDLEVLVDDRPEVTLVAIRGTEASRLLTERGVIDALRDVNVRPYFIGGYGYGPRGALRGAEAILPDLLDYLTWDKPVRLTGHSMGGQIACPVSVMLSNLGAAVTGCVTFGAPRAIARWSARPQLSYPVTQYDYGDDPAPLWPYLRYKHLAKKVIKLAELDKDYGFDHWIDNYEMALCSS